VPILGSLLAFLLVCHPKSLCEGKRHGPIRKTEQHA
jgi:hypothetical protein